MNRFTVSTFRVNKRIWLYLLAAGLIGLLIPALTWAHAEYDRSEPAADAVIAEAPAEVHVWFTQELFRREGANNIEVTGPDGARVDQGDSRIDDDDRTHLLVSLQPDLPPGRYLVRWQALSIEDGHEGEGEFGFTVDPSAPANSAPDPAAATAEPATVSTPAAEPAVIATPAPEPAAPGSSSLPCLGGLIFGGLLLAVKGPLRRERGRS
jgi:methionine-rich copper-binding protein CopC